MARSRNGSWVSMACSSACGRSSTATPCHVQARPGERPDRPLPARAAWRTRPTPGTAIPSAARSAPGPSTTTRATSPRHPASWAYAAAATAPREPVTGVRSDQGRRPPAEPRTRDRASRASTSGGERRRVGRGRTGRRRPPGARERHPAHQAGPAAMRHRHPAARPSSRPARRSGRGARSPQPAQRPSSVSAVAADDVPVALDHGRAAARAGASCRPRRRARCRCRRSAARCRSAICPGPAQRRRRRAAGRRAS